MTTPAVDAPTFEEIVNSWDQSLICESIHGCPNTAAWLVVHHCIPRAGRERAVVCSWHRLRWLREVRLIIAAHGHFLCDCGRHFTSPDESAAFTRL